MTDDDQFPGCFFLSKINNQYTAPLKEFLPNYCITSNKLIYERVATQAETEETKTDKKGEIRAKINQNTWN